MKKYTMSEIQKGFENLGMLLNENQLLKSQMKKLKEKLATYEAAEVGNAMSKMGYNEKEAIQVVTILKRAIGAQS